MVQPLVSVIIPIYNAEKYVIESIQSVLDQDYKNLEIIISDDCSTDSTKQVILNFLKEKNLPFVKLFFNSENLGVTRNCNQCLRACTGKYIAFHAGDDIMLPSKISTQVNYLESHSNCKISYHNIDVFDSDTNKTLYSYNSFFRQKGRSGDVRQLIKHGCFCGGCSIMVRREEIPPKGYDEEFTIASDWFLWICILLGGGEIHYINKVLARYRRHTSNVTVKNSSMAFLSYYQSLCVINKLIINNPSYLKEAINAYGFHLRSLRNHYNGLQYRRFLFHSLRLHFSIKTLILILINLFSFNRIRI